ncbi:MarR family transcriptional regulator [uncultured Croceitalea sp.]|uniref:MarR family winged helix-turn-helix transcriptional regulator n=1 Tax=uncultured Croceitalea sp. TaxID=1798908 RepID=UPI0033061B88
MGDDLIRQLNHASLDARLKRISDKMSHSVRAMYKKMALDVEPNWYLVLTIVNKAPDVSVMEIAHQLRFTHQSVINITNKMVAKGYLKNMKDTHDKRKTVFQLTEKATQKLPLFTQIWDCGTAAIFESLNGDVSIIQHLNTLETNLEELSFGDRILEKLEAAT